MKTRKQRKEESKEAGKFFLVSGSVVLAVCLIYLTMFAPVHTVHTYDIKAEQVYDNDRINDSVQLDTLSEDERSLLHDAFKKSDHFLGSSQVSIERSDKLETFDGWKVVEFQGVYILVAIDGPDTRETWVGWVPWAVLIIGFLSAASVLVSIKEIIWPSPY